jgi:hypothetical protein
MAVHCRPRESESSNETFRRPLLDLRGFGGNLALGILLGFEALRFGELVIAPSSEPLSQGTFLSGNFPFLRAVSGSEFSADFVEAL